MSVAGHGGGVHLWTAKDADREKLGEALKKWRLDGGREGQGGFMSRRAGQGRDRTLIDTCITCLAKSISSGKARAALENVRVYVEPTFIERALMQAANLCPSGIDDDTLLLIMQLAPISSLPLAGCTGVTDDTLKAAIQLGADIKHADLRRCTITPQGLSVFAKNLPLLQSLDVGMCEGVTDFAVTRVCILCKRLEELRLAGCHRLTDASAEAIAMHVTSGTLRLLDLTDIEKLGDEALVKVARSQSSLQALSLGGCVRTGPDAVWNLSPRVTVRQHDVMSWEDVVDQQLEQHQVSGCPNLSSLSLCKCDLVSDRALQRLIACDALRQLDIAECRKITDSSIMAIVKARALSCLILRGCHGLTDASLQMLARNCCSLKILDVSECPSFTDRSMHLVLKMAKRLQALCTSYTNIKDDGVKCLTETHRWLDETEIEEGELPGCVLSEFRAAGTTLKAETVVRILKVCSRLSNLNLAGVRLTDEERRRVADAAKDRIGTCRVVFDYELEPKIWGIPIFSS